MPVTKEQAHMIAALAVAARPARAPKWDAPGVVAALAKVNHLALADVVAATMRAASDRNAQTPGVISATNSLHWAEKVAERATPTPPKRGEACLTCGKPLPCNPLTCDTPSTRPVGRNPRNSELAALARTALRTQQEDIA